MCCRFGDSGGLQQCTPRVSKGSPTAKSDNAGGKASEGILEGQPLWWRAGRLPSKGPRAADEESQQNEAPKVQHKRLGGMTYTLTYQLHIL